MSKLLLPKLIGHRGAAGHAPENTLSSIRKAKELGLKWVEFDVMLSGCGQPIIIHDIKLNRTTNGRGKVAHFSYEELVKLDAGSWFSKEFLQHRIPTLEEMILCLKELDLNAVIEIKPYPEQEVITAKKTYALIAKLWPEGFEKIIFASFSLESLKTIRKLCNKQAIGYGLHRWDRLWHDIIHDLNCTSIHVNHWILSRKRTSQLKASGRHIICYTVNDPSRAQKLFEWGVDGIFSDFPDRFPEHTQI